MNNKFTALAQANVDHYNAHPVAHTVIAVGWLVFAVDMSRRLIRRLNRDNCPVDPHF